MLRPDEVLCESVTYLILWQTGKGFDDGSKGHLALLGQISSAGKRVGGAADESGAGITFAKRSINNLLFIPIHIVILFQYKDSSLFLLLNLSQINSL